MRRIIIHISVDGLAPRVIDKLGKDKLPNFYFMQKNGIYTHNARTDKYLTLTLPNHMSMFTGRGSLSVIMKNNSLYKGHEITFNIDNLEKIHNMRKEYVYTIFDNIKKNKMRSAMFVGKTKFDFVDRSYSENTGVLFKADGIDEIDKFYMDTEYKLIIDGKCKYFRYDQEISKISSEPIQIVNEFLKSFEEPYDYNFIHFRGTDSTGHQYGWDSDVYENALMGIDDDIGYIINKTKAAKYEYIIILTSDHGGVEKSHHDNNNPLNFTIPFYVLSNKTITNNNDIYKYNPQRTNPDPNSNPDYNDVNIAIRNSDVANLALKLLGIQPIEGSWINPNQDLAIY